MRNKNRFFKLIITPGDVSYTVDLPQKSKTSSDNSRRSLKRKRGEGKGELSSQSNFTDRETQ